MYGTSVLLKAGHLTEDKLVDIFYDAENKSLHYLESARVHTRNTHGTGCTMSSAFATLLAKEYINGATVSGEDYSICHGFGPVNHFYELWK